MNKKLDNPFTKEMFLYLTSLEEEGVNMWEASTVVKKNYPSMSIKQCNDVVIDWMQTTNFHARWNKPRI
jgi:hypothetical protein